MKSGYCIGCKQSALLLADYCESCEREYESQFEDVHE